MTRQEIKDWIRGARFHRTEMDDWDGNGNHHSVIIYEKQGKLFRIQFCNDEPDEKWGEKGFIRGDYKEPQEVVMKKRVIEEIYYEPELR